MFIYTAKLRRKRFLLGVVALVVACGLFTAIASSHSFWGAKSVSSTSTIDHKGIKTNEDRVNYLSEYGWAVDDDAAYIEELKVPKTFDESYDDYLALQLDQGFDLTKYGGKTVKRYTYAISNYPDGTEDMMVSILIYKKTVIGGEVFSAVTGEVLHGLALPT